MSDFKSVLIGYSGHSFVVLDAMIAAGKTVEFYSEKFKKEDNPFKLIYLGDDSHPEFKGWKMDLDFILGVGNNIIREKLGLSIKSKNKRALNVIHPSALISNNVQLGDGIFISKGVMINPFSSIGDFVILNTGCIIEHGCQIGQAAHIAPGAVLAGDVKIGKRTFIGANSVIKEGIEIGDDVIIGAGTVVINDVTSGSKIIGNPGKKI